MVYDPDQNVKVFFAPVFLDPLVFEHSSVTKSLPFNPFLQDASYETGRPLAFQIFPRILKNHVNLKLMDPFFDKNHKFLHQFFGFA